MHVSEMLNQVRDLHEKRGFRTNGGEDPVWRIALLCEEVGELAAAVTKGHGDPAAEIADILISLLGTCVAMEVDIEDEFRKKMAEIEGRRSIFRNGHVRLAKEGDHGP